MKKIKFLITGGTIDKIYSEYKGDLSYTVSNIDHIIKQSRMTVDYSIQTITLKDSLDLNASDRIYMREYCKTVEDECIIVIHGTDTIVDTAKALSTLKDKTIILTGSIIPYVVANSDAMFNIGCAIAYSQSLQHGTYVVMNGIAFDVLNVVKNKETQQFQSLYKE